MEESNSNSDNVENTKTKTSEEAENLTPTTENASVVTEPLEETFPCSGFESIQGKKAALSRKS
jgi:hypothetical protein